MRRFVWALCLVIVSIFRSPAAVAQPEQQPAAGDFPSRWTFHSSTGAIKGEREWILRDGTKLKGIAILNAAELVEVQRQSSPGPGPSAAYVPLAEFTDEDQATIRAGLPSVPPEYRQYSLYQGIEVIPEWDGVKPKFPDRFNKVISGKHAENSKLHHAIGFLLLPRWHGKPGASEGYRDSVDAKLGGAAGKAMYAQLAADMLVVHGFAQPLSSQMEIDLQRVFDGTQDYYKSHTDATLVDMVILLMTIEAKNDWVTRLLQLKFEKQLLPSQTVASSPETFRSIERQLGK